MKKYRFILTTFGFRFGLGLTCLSLGACTPSSSSVQQNTPPTPVATTPQSNHQHHQNSQSQSDGIWIDVRSAEEFQQGHLNHAVNIPHGHISQHIAQVAPDKNQPIHLYCQSGRRAEIALQELKKLGYTQVVNHGAYADLVQKGMK